MSGIDHVEHNLQRVKMRIRQAAEQAGRDPKSVRLVAVSKTFPAEDIMYAYRCGQRVFGENRVVELEEKYKTLPDDIEWHLIGHLQSNKAARALQYADVIHSIDSMKLVKRLNRLAQGDAVRPKILLEFNISREESKSGASIEIAPELTAAAVAATNLEVVGLMTMAPFGADTTALRRVFSGLRQLRDKLEQEYDIKLPELSMGMSSDFEIAVEEGATLVRVGSAIFGHRN